MAINFFGVIASRTVKLVNFKVSFIMTLVFLCSCANSNVEIFSLYKAQPLMEDISEFRKKESTLIDMGFGLKYGKPSNETQQIWIYKNYFLNFDTSDPVIILIVRNGKIHGKGIRVLEGNYSICNAPADVGEIEATIALPDGRPCF